MASELPPELDAELRLTRSSIPERSLDSPIHLGTIRGSKAALLLVVFLVVLSFNALHTRSLSTTETAALSRGLGLQYSTRFISSGDWPTSTPEQQQAFSERAATLQDVSLASATAKGWRASSVVRAEIEVSGQIPPDGESVRFFQMSCSASCHITGEVSRLSYSLGLWFMEADVASFP